MKAGTKATLVAPREPCAAQFVPPDSDRLTPAQIEQLRRHGRKVSEYARKIFRAEVSERHE